MKMNKKFFLLPFVCTAVITLTSLSAEEPSLFPEVQPVNAVNEEGIADSLLVEDLQETIGYGSDEAYLSRLHNDSYSHLFGFTPDGSTIQMMDGSKWSVLGEGNLKVTNWVKSDDIFIKPALWYAPSKYVFYNRTLNETVSVNLIAFPSQTSDYTFKISNINYTKRWVLLNDNTVWQVGPDVSFSSWQIGDRVLVGVNNYWRTTAYPQIIINVEIQKAPYCSAIFYGYPQ